MTRKPGIPGPKPGANPGKKRKQDKDLSKNPHTMRGRELLASKSDSEKAVIRRKNNDRAAFVSARLKLRASTSWQEATMEEQEILEISLKDQVMRERYEKGQSAQFFLDQLEGESIDSSVWETVDFENDTELCYHAQLDDIASHETIPTTETAKEAEAAQSSATGQLIKTLHTITWGHFRLSLLRSLASLDMKLKILGKMESCHDPLYYNGIPFCLKSILPEKVFLKEERAAWSIMSSISSNPWATLPGPADWWEGYSCQSLAKFWGFASKEEAKALYRLGIYIIQNKEAPENAGGLIDEVMGLLELLP
ncbi:uncharacterized protein ACHE_11481S [Aspergillus chevalieri]|uniref:Uncharacterized protein n=1 Tax=Aspergillus chevalieri TaxID=182096 RepID=A0A7R7ZK02_ASPCH|nr:uncharacterized protein ACHE_11481S [Aspergillus chevalieri]BCR84079.1 hypothetical protein ACHE_11481S [Aspergillus chevalieri]